MANELITQEDMAYSAEMAALLGVDGAGFTAGSGIPALKINYDHDTEDGCRLQAGYFYVDVPGEEGEKATRVYGKEVVFRPFINRFQFVHYDATGNDGNGEYLNKSIYVPDLNKTEALDELGGSRCGKLTTKQYDEIGNKITPEQAKLKSDVKLFRVAFGTVSFMGTTAPHKDEAGEEVAGVPFEVKDLPVVFKMRGSNFAGLGDVLKELDSLKRYPFTALLNVTTKREKKGTLVFYVLKYAYDKSVSAPLGAEGIALVNKFNETIKAENEAVIKKHKKALEDNEDVNQAQDVGNALGGDFDDEIPF